MPKSDRTRLHHMLDAAREAMRSASGRSRRDLDADLVWTLGLVKCVEIVGEAAARIGKETKERNPQIPWAQIVAMRNRLVHLYFDIDLDQVWNAVTEDLPALVMQLQQMLERDSLE
jgi:uncharacterized protein with HEPN domain